jgi:hypothetical protein
MGFFLAVAADMAHEKGHEAKLRVLISSVDHNDPAFSAAGLVAIATITAIATATATAITTVTVSAATTITAAAVAATTVAATATAVTTTTTATAFARPCFVDHDSAAVQCGAVERPDGFIATGSHFDETEAL